jgi:hypothetical protein
VSQQLGSRQYGLLLPRMLRLLNEFTAECMVGTLSAWNNSSSSHLASHRNFC